MKKFLRKVAVFVAVILALTLLPAYVIDPYNVMHWDNIRDNGVEPNKNYIKTQYIIENPDKFDGYILGSSRVGSIHVEKITDEHLYNMTYSGGIPANHVETLQAFLDNGVTVKSIYMGVDNISYTFSPADYTGTPLRASWQELQSMDTFFNIYMNPKMNIQSLEVIANKRPNPNISAFYTYGWDINYNEISSYDWDNAYPVTGSRYLMESTLADIAQVKKLCDENGIKLVIWTNPLHHLTYEDALNRNYLGFLEQLAQITDYYNFSGLNEITTNNDNFVDPSHFRAEIGDIMIDIMWNGASYEDLHAQGFGWYVTKDNVHELLEILK